MLDEKVVQELMKQEWKERTSSWGKNYFIEAGDYSVELKQGEIPGTIIQQMERKNWMRFKKKISNILTQHREGLAALQEKEPATYESLQELKTDINTAVEDLFKRLPNVKYKQVDVFYLSRFLATYCEDDKAGQPPKSEGEGAVGIVKQLLPKIKEVTEFEHLDAAE